jgi:hypothetical protein
VKYLPQPIIHRDGARRLKCPGGDAGRRSTEPFQRLFPPDCDLTVAQDRILGECGNCEADPTIAKPLGAAIATIVAYISSGRAGQRSCGLVPLARRQERRAVAPQLRDGMQRPGSGIRAVMASVRKLASFVRFRTPRQCFQQLGGCCLNVPAWGWISDSFQRYLLDWPLDTHSERRYLSRFRVHY